VRLVSSGKSCCPSTAVNKLLQAWQCAKLLFEYLVEVFIQGAWRAAACCGPYSNLCCIMHSSHNTTAPDAGSAYELASTPLALPTNF